MFAKIKGTTMLIIGAGGDVHNRWESKGQNVQLKSVVGSGSQEELALTMTTTAT